LSVELERVAAAFRSALPTGHRLATFRIDQLDRIGVPVTQAILVLDNEPATIGYGYGATPVEAEVGALGELCEEVHVGRAVAEMPRVVDSYANLARTRGPGAVADPLTLCLPAGSAYTPDMVLPWIEAQRWPSGETVLVPREWVAAYPYQLGEAPVLITPITNGLGAGLDREHAIAHGVMELLQRDGNVVTYRALDQGVVIDIDIPLADDTTALLAKLDALGIAVTVKLACTEMGFTNLYVVGNDPDPGVPVMVTACGEASHPDRDRALRKALLEFIGSRARKASTHAPIPLVRSALPASYVDAQIKVALIEEEETRALEAMADWVGQDAAELRRRLNPSVFSRRTQVAFSSLPTVAHQDVSDGAARLALITERLAGEGLEVLWVNCSPEGSGVSVAKAIVPSMESETMSYHRIGWRGVRRLRMRNDPLIFDTPKPGTKRVMLRPEDEAQCGGPAWFDVAAADRMVGSLYALYRESGPFSAQLLLERQRRNSAA
jgi:YcaO-like protein with predicted kinase domain